MRNLVLKLDLGPSLKYSNRSVNDILSNAVPVSLILGLLAFLLASISGIAIGLGTALKPDSLLAKLCSDFSLFGISMPSFVFAGILISIFGLQLGLLPIALWEGPLYMILPVLTLAIAPTAYIARITRAATLETLNQTYIRTALAKGLAYQEIVIKHVLNNSLIPIITILGPIFAILITGSFVVEYIYAIPGMGKYFVTAFINRDYFLVSGVVIIFSVLLLMANLLVDILVLALDPKQR